MVKNGDGQPVGFCGCAFVDAFAKVPICLSQETIPATSCPKSVQLFKETPSTRNNLIQSKRGSEPPPPQVCRGQILAHPMGMGKHKLEIAVGVFHFF